MWWIRLLSNSLSSGIFLNLSSWALLSSLTFPVNPKKQHGNSLTQFLACSNSHVKQYKCMGWAGAQFFFRMFRHLKCTSAALKSLLGPLTCNTNDLQILAKLRTSMRTSSFCFQSILNFQHVMYVTRHNYFVIETYSFTVPKRQLMWLIFAKDIYFYDYDYDLNIFYRYSWILSHGFSISVIGL